MECVRRLTIRVNSARRTASKHLVVITLTASISFKARPPMVLVILLR